MSDTVNINVKSWHYKLVSTFLETWNIETICEYWVKVYSVAFGLLLSILFILYGYYSFYMEFTVQNYQLDFFALLAFVASLLFSLFIFAIYFIIFIDYVQDMWNNKLFKKCKRVKFSREYE